jgi:hypothetical protein
LCKSAIEQKYKRAKAQKSNSAEAKKHNDLFHLCTFELLYFCSIILSGTMTKIIMMFLSVMMLLSAGCAKEESDLKEERESLEKYADIFTLADLRRIVSYPGTIEKEVVKTPQAVHVNFYIPSGCPCQFLYPDKKIQKEGGR